MKEKIISTIRVPTGEQSGLWMRIATTVNASLCARMKSLPLLLNSNLRFGLAANWAWLA